MPQSYFFNFLAVLGSNWRPCLSRCSTTELSPVQNYSPSKARTRSRTVEELATNSLCHIREVLLALHCNRNSRHHIAAPLNLSPYSQDSTLYFSNSLLIVLCPSFGRSLTLSLSFLFKENNGVLTWNTLESYWWPHKIKSTAVPERKYSLTPSIHSADIRNRESSYKETENLPLE